MPKRLQLSEIEEFRRPRPNGRPGGDWKTGGAGKAGPPSPCFGATSGTLCPTRRGFWIVTLAFILLAGGRGRAANFTAELDPVTINLGESAALTLTYEGGTQVSPPVFPAIPNLRIVDAHQTSQQFSFGNGQTSATIKSVYEVTATQPGDYTIPELTVIIGGQVCKSQPIKLTVLKPGAPPPADAAAAPQLLALKLVIPKTQVYVGETLQVELQLSVQDGVSTRQGSEQLTPVQAEGFTVGKMVQGQRRQTRVGNVGYTVIPLNLSFTAVKVGSLTLGPAAFQATLLLPPYNIFGQPTKQQQANASSEPVALQVLPLPKENVPAGFNGAVGSYSLNLEVSPTNIAVGDPLTVKVQIKGRGALEAVTLPEQPQWQHFKLYPPTSEFQPADNDPLGLSGTKSFALTVVPETMELRELPAFAFSFFDPDQKRYQTLTHPAVPLTVRPSASSLPPPVLSGSSGNQDSAPPPTRDIVHIKPRIGTLAEVRTPLALQPWFLAAQGLPVMAWLALFIGHRQKERLANNPRLRRQRLVEKVVRQGFKELRQAANANERETFFGTLFHLLQEQLGERLDLPASAITEAVVDERLPAARVPAETSAALHELFQTCNQARYARQGTTGELVSLLPKVESVLRELRKIQA
jgi:hypothetical protein